MSRIRLDVSQNERKALILEEFNNMGLNNYYMRIFDRDCDVETRAMLLLKFLGMDPSQSGTTYTISAIKVLAGIKSNEYISMFDIYEKVAKEYDVTDLVVERSIRRAKERLLMHLDFNVKILVFGNVLDHKTNRIKNSSFIYSLTYFLKSFEV